MRKSWILFAIVAIGLLVLWGRRAGVRVEYPTARSETSAPTPPREETAKTPEVAPTATKPAPKSVSPQAAERPKARELTPEQIFCLLNDQKVGIPLDGEVRIQSLDIDNPDGTIGKTYLVRSAACPPGMFSIVYTNDQGQLAGEVSCRDASPKDLVLDLGVQAEVTDTDPGPNQVDMALTGPGYFVVECDIGFRLTRLGHFDRDDKGQLLDEDGCRLWTRPNGPISPGQAVRLEPGEKLDEKGCRPDGTCIGVIDPRDVDPNTIEINDDKSFRITQIPPSSFITPSVASDAVENIEDPDRGPGGWKRWELVDPVPSNLRCPARE